MLVCCSSMRSFLQSRTVFLVLNFYNSKEKFFYQLSGSYSIQKWYDEKEYGTIHLRRRQIFTTFDSYPLPSAVFLLLSVGKFDQFFTPTNCRRLKWMVPIFYTRWHWVNTHKEIDILERLLFNVLSERRHLETECFFNLFLEVSQI